MKLSSVLLARVIGFLDINDVNPRGKAFFPFLVALLIEKYKFQKFPSKPDDFDEQKGVVFEMGYDGNTTIDRITVWNNAIGVDVRSSTSEAQVILDSALTWLAEQGGLSYQTGAIKRWGFLSNLSFYADFDLDDINPAVRSIAKRVSEAVQKEQGLNLDYHTFGITVNFDRTFLNSPIAYFSIQRRTDEPFESRKYFSEGPLPTDVHIKLLEQFEKEIKQA